MKRKRCKDPICPANQSPPRAKREEKSKKRATVARGRSRTTDCRNKMCQASRSTAESSTSTSRPRARSRESVRWCRSVSKSRRRRACHCRRIREARKRSASPRQKKTKRSRCKTFSKKRKKQPALCVCVRGSSSQDLGRKRPSACPILSKYDECCCTQKRKSKSKRKDKSNSGRGKPTRQCHCEPPASNSMRSVIERGLSNLSKKLEKLKFSFPRRRTSKACPAQRYCSRDRQGKPRRSRKRDRNKRGGK
ncbi:hypothetical protein QLX08_001031 [Tetragonisca angustula]|uniref:Uncharacterized protein n=1 Tax=Tetragonisca angustula TaxID=166442 RepID=A0AAW1AHA5_9HYME